MDQLVEIALSNVGYGDAFFAWPEEAADRFDELVRESTRNDPEGTAGFLRWLRRETPMRGAALAGVAAFVIERLVNEQHGMSRQLVNDVLRRADDPGHLLRHWLSVYGPIPKPVKRGVADAVRRLYDRAALAEYDTDASHTEGAVFQGIVKAVKPLRFRDVIALTHPVAADQDQAEVFRLARIGDRAADRADRRIALDEPGWNRLVEGMSLRGLLASLRRFDKARIPFETAMTVAARIADPAGAPGVGPMRFYAAWQAVGTTRWWPSLAAGARHSLASIPVITGRTLIIIQPGTARGAVFGLALARRCESASVRSTSGQPFGVIAGESPLHGLIRWQATDFGPDNKDTITGVEHNRVVRITTWADNLAEVDADVPVYTWQIENAQDPAPGRPVFHGVPDAALSVIPIIEGARPWHTPART